MAKDVLITPLDGIIQFSGSDGAGTGQIKVDGDNLVISNLVGDVLLGDGASDVFIGNGTDNVDIVFEQNGEIRDDGSGKTITLGSKTTTLILSSSSDITLQGGGGNVGIGTTTAGEVLEVVGNISSSDTVKANKVTVDIGDTNGLTFKGKDEYIYHGSNDVRINTSDSLRLTIEDEGIDVVGSITASNNISSSTTIKALAFTSAEKNVASFADGAKMIYGSSGVPSHFASDITASGNISASGDIFANEITLTGASAGIKIEGDSGTELISTGTAGAFNITSAHDLFLLAASSKEVRIGSNNTNDEIRLNKGHITASGDISASSGTISGLSGSFRNLDILDNDAGVNPRLRVGRNTNENIQFSVVDNDVRIIADQDSDSNGEHNFTLNRTFEGTGSNNFKIQKGGTDQFVIGTGGDITASGDISASGTLTVGSFTLDNVNTGNITASGDISASGNISATGNLDIDGLVDFGSAFSKVSTNDSNEFRIEDVQSTPNVAFIVKNLDDVSDNAGKVGINTVNPTKALQVAGDISASGTSSFGLGIFDTSVLVGQTTHTGYGTVTANTNDLIVNGQFSAAGSAGSAIYKLQIGTTLGLPSAEGDLNVGGDISASGEVAGATLDINGNGNFEGNITLGADKYIGRAANNSILFNDSNGILIKDSANIEVRIDSDGSGGAAAKFIVGTNNQGTDTLDGTELMIVSASGNVGIGTTSPGEKLEVIGNISSSGTVFADNITFDGPRAVDANTIKFGGLTELSSSKTAGLQWDFPNDDAFIYAHQSSSDVTNFVFEQRDNTSADKFTFWFNDYRGSGSDSFPLEMRGDRFVVNNIYDKTVAYHRDSHNQINLPANNVDFYLLKSGSTSVSSGNSLIFGDVSEAEVTMNGALEVTGNISGSSTSTLSAGTVTAKTLVSTPEVRNTGADLIIDVGENNKIQFSDDGQSNNLAKINSSGIFSDNHITASGDISASGEIRSATMKVGTPIYAAVHASTGSLFVKADANGHAIAIEEAGTGTERYAIGVDTAGALTFTNLVADTPTLTIGDNDKVGIGVTTPSNTLDIHGSLVVSSSTAGHITASGNISASGVSHTFAGDIFLTDEGAPTLTLTDTTNNYGLVIQQGNSTAYIGFDDHANQDLQFDSNADNYHMYLEGSSGFTGLGTNSPATKLDVDGAITTNSHITASGDISSSGTLISTNASIDRIDRIDDAKTGVAFGDGINVINNSHITASGNISASGEYIGNQIQIYQANFTDDIATTTHFVPLGTSTFEATTEDVAHAGLVAPYDGELVKIIYRHSFDASSTTTRWVFSVITDGTDMDGTATTRFRGSVTGATTDDIKEVTVADADSELLSNMTFSKGETIFLSLRNSADVTTSTSTDDFHITVVLKFNIPLGLI